MTSGRGIIRTYPFWVCMADVGTEFVYRQMRFTVISLEDREVALSGATTNLAYEVDIPSKVRFNNEEYTVVTIFGMAFTDAGRVRSVRYPGTMTYLMSHAFAGADLDPTFEIPAYLEFFGGYHFAGCTGLREVVLPEGMVDIPSGMFNDCLSLVSVRMGSNVETIGDYAFMGCKNLTTVVSDESIDVDDPDAVVLPKSVCEVGGSSFSDTRILRVYTDADIGKRYDDVPEFKRRTDGSGKKRVRSGFVGPR